MSPQSLRVPAQSLNHRYVRTGALCAVIESLNTNGPHVSFQTEEEAAVSATCVDKFGGAENAGEPTIFSVSQSATSMKLPPSEDPIVQAFTLHMDTLLKSSNPCFPKTELLNFKKNVWPQVELLLRSSGRNCTENIISHWKQIELLVGGIYDRFLQEGALMLTLVMGEIEPISEFCANFEGLETCILDSIRNESLPSNVKTRALKFKDELLQYRNEVQEVSEGGMQGNVRIKAFKTRCETLLAQFKALVDQIPQSRPRDIFKRQGFKCLMSLQECHLPPLITPEVVAFSKSLKAIAANTGEFELFDQLFRVISTTLRDADNSPTPQIASLLAAQCNEILSNHGHLLSPVVVNILKAQGEAAFKRVSEAASEDIGRPASRKPFIESEGWMAQLVDTVSDFVHKRWGASEDESIDAEGIPQVQGGPSTAFDFIASVNPALAGTMKDFMTSVQVELVGVPLKGPQLLALQRLLRSELYIVNQLKKSCQGATRSESEMKIREMFTTHVDLLWPFLTDDLDPKVCKALKEKRTRTFTTLNQTSTLWSLIEKAKKLTSDPRVLAVCSVILLSKYFSGAEGASIPDTSVDTSNYSLIKVTQNDWKYLVCPVLNLGRNTMDYWYEPIGEHGPRQLYMCVDKSSRMADKVVQIWRDMRKNQSLCTSDIYKRAESTFQVNSAYQSQIPVPLPIDFDCSEVMRKELRRVDDSIGELYCPLGEQSWQVPVNIDPEGYPFTYCVDSNPVDTRALDTEVAEFLNSTHDVAQYKQLQCRPSTATDLTQGISSKLAIGNAKLTHTPLDVLTVESEDIGVWWKHCRYSEKFRHFVTKEMYAEYQRRYATTQGVITEAALPIELSTQTTHSVTEPSVLEPSVTPLDTELTPSTQSPPSSTYILGPLSSTLPPGKHSAIKMDNVTYGLYERTSSGIIAVQNETYTPTAEPPHTAPPTQPTTIDFTYPIYPAVVMSNSTAVSQVVSQTVPWMYRLANAVWSQCILDSTMAVLPYAASASVLAAIAGAVYCHCNRQPQKKKAGAVTDSNGPLDIDSLWGMEMVRSDISRPAKERRPLLRRKETSF